MGARTAAVLVNYNGGQYNAPCIDSLLAQEDTEIIFVDNASTDGSCDETERRYGGRITVLRMPTNVGFARACNAGAGATNAPLLLFFNNDAIAGEGMVATMRAALEQDGQLGVVGPVVLDARDPRIVQYTGPTIDRWGFTVDPTSGRPASLLPPAAIRECFYISGCALMIAADRFAELHGFDEGMFMFCEDVDLCWRAQLIGLRVATIREASCRHVGGGTATAGRIEGAYRTSAFRIVEREKNTFRMMSVNLDGVNLLRYLILHYPFWIAEALAALLVGKPWIAAAYWHGFIASLGQLAGVRARRRWVQASRTTPDAAILAKWSPYYEKLRFIRRVGLPRSA